MSEKKYCYRYVDGNDYLGRAVILLWKMVVIRETEKTFWYTHDMPNMHLAQMQQYRGRSGDKNVKRCLKGAARSRYHLTKEEALKAFMHRKCFQLERLALTQETVRLCLDGLVNGGFVQGSEDGRVNGFSKILEAPGSGIVAADEPGEIASNYSWGEW